VAERLIMPTRLGNILRAAEEGLRRTGREDVEGYVIRRLDQLPAPLVAQNRDWRGRLELYCILVFCAAGLVPASAFLLRGVDGRAAAVTAFAYLILASVSYRAALAAGRGYGSTLRAIGAWQTPDTPDYVSSANLGAATSVITAPQVPQARGEVSTR
jgi:hypothetical protein